jgi:hypothetical protein
MPSAKGPKAKPLSNAVKTAVSAPKVTTSVTWPPLPTPAQRSHPLELEEILSRQLVLLHGFFPSKACSTWINFLSEQKNVLLEATPPAKRGEAQRTNHRFSIQDQTFARQLWEDTGLADIVKNDQTGMFESSETMDAKPIGLNPNIRVREFINDENSSKNKIRKQMLMTLRPGRYIVMSQDRALLRTTMIQSK